MLRLVNDKELDTSNFIFRTLKEEIIHLIILPGAAISESEVCSRFSVSRTPVRSAFQRLSDMKLIKVVPYRGICASLINLHQLKQMIYMRIAIESKVIRDFIDVYKPLDLEKIRYFLRKQAIQTGNACGLTDFYSADAAFHRIWFKTVDKEFLWRKIQHAQVHYTRFRLLDYAETKKLGALVKEHEQLFSIISQKRKDDVEPFITKHLNGGIKRLGKRIYTEFASFFEMEQTEADEPRGAKREA